MSPTKARVWETNIDESIIYVSLTGDRLDEAIEVLNEAFFKHENVCKAIGLPNNPEAIKECDEMVRDTAKQGVSVIAIHKDTNKIVGVSLNKIQHKNTASNEYNKMFIEKAKYKETKTVLEFMAHWEDSVDPFTPNNADCLMELVFLGVLPEFSGKGIGYTLSAVSLRLATKLFKGENVKTSLDGTELPLEPRPQVMTSLFTTVKTQKIGKKLNFDILATVSYKSLFYEGKSYASIIGNETELISIECKRLE